jgi:hypothetical protein
MKNISKPKLIFFQWYYEEVPLFLRLHLQQQVKCLSQSFEVIVVSENCDYDEVCDKYQPDLTLFEAGVYTRNFGSNHRAKIKNTFTHPEIPKLGFLNADAYCASRTSFIAEMVDWGIETFFTLSVSMGEYMPEISNNLFVWPNFIDAEVYKDYGQPKNIPFFLTGSQASHYPFRNKIFEILSQHYPSLNTPHLGWHGTSTTSRMIYGEQYARTLNASWFVPTCGTIAKEVIRKHFEIPACKACLITEKTLGLEAAGFTDMENCVFVDENNVLNKIDYLMHNLDEVERIIDNGYQLVHSRHTLKQRDSILQWFNLNKNIQSSQKIIQASPFEPLRVVDRASGIGNSHIISGGIDRILLSDGDEKMYQGKYREAEVSYQKCINYQSYIPEPKLGLMLCHLYQGNPDRALTWIVETMQDTLNYSASVPEPVQWAYFIIVLLCQGKLNEAVKCSAQFPLLTHPELDRARAISNVLKDGKQVNLKISKNSIKRRYSIHQLPETSFEEWAKQICNMLEASKQFRFARILKISSLMEQEILIEQGKNKDDNALVAPHSLAVSNLSGSQSRAALSIISEIMVSEKARLDLKQNRLNQRIKRQLRMSIKKNILRFLNYHSIKNPLFLKRIQELLDSMFDEVKGLAKDHL